MFHRKRESIEAHQTIVFAALAIARHLQQVTGVSIKKLVTTLRPLREITLSVAGQTITAAPKTPAEVCRPTRPTGSLNLCNSGPNVASVTDRSNAEAGPPDPGVYTWSPRDQAGLKFEEPGYFSMPVSMSLTKPQPARLAPDANQVSSSSAVTR